MNLSVESSPNLLKTPSSRPTAAISSGVSNGAVPTSVPGSVTSSMSGSMTGSRPGSSSVPTIHNTVPNEAPTEVPKDQDTQQSVPSTNSQDRMPKSTNYTNFYSSSSCSSSSSSLGKEDTQEQKESPLYDSGYVHQDINTAQRQSEPVSSPVIPIDLDKNLKVLPVEFKDCPRDDLIVLISRMLTHIISLNDEIDVKISSKQLTRFHSRAPPNISIYSYLSRLAHYSSLDNAILITAVYYIDLLSSTYPVFSINSLTVHRFLLTATTVASKGLCDSFCSNTHYAKVGGVHITELNVLEAEFLTNVNWRIVPHDFTDQDTSNRAKQRRNSSTGTLQDDNFNANKVHHSGVASAKEVLTLYYGRMVTLFGTPRSISMDDTPEPDTTFVLAQSENISEPLSSTGAPAANNSYLKRNADHIDAAATRGKRRN